MDEIKSIKLPESGSNTEKIKEKIISTATEIIKSNPNGIRCSEIAVKIHEEFPGIPVETIKKTIWNLEKQASEEVYKNHFIHIRCCRLQAQACFLSLLSQFKDA